MKLILLSEQNHLTIEDVKTQLISLIGKSNSTIGYISSCPDPSRKFYNERKEYYAQFGSSLTPYVDLETEFDSKKIDLVFQADAIHLSGGNTYRFFHWIIKRGLRERLRKYAQSKVIIGLSAGAIIMTPDISYSNFCGDRNEVGLKEFKGLALANFNFVPHAISRDTVHQDILLKSQQDNSRVVVAKDSDWVVIDRPNCRVYGKPKLVVAGEIVDLSSFKI